MLNMPNLGNLNELLGRSGEINAQLKNIKEELEETKLTGESGGGLVEATTNGLGRLLSIKISEDNDMNDREFLEDLILSAVNSAAAKAKALSHEKYGVFASAFEMMNM